MEVWRPISEYPNYEVSNFGRVRSINHIDKLNRVREGKILKPCFDSNGNYLHVNLRKDGKQKSTNVHRLVAITFIPNPNNYTDINHIDRDKTNNCVSNLEWCTRKYNNEYSNTGFKGGEENPSSKITKEVATFIRENHIPNDPNFGTTALSKRFGISLSEVSAIAHRKRWAV